MKNIFWVLVMPFLLIANSGVDLGVDRLYLGIQSVPNSSTVCKLVLQLKVVNMGDVESPVCDLEFFAAPVRDDKSFPCCDKVEVPVIAAGESFDYKKEWRIDKIQADQLCKDLCCGMMLVKASLVFRDSIIDTNERNNEIVSFLLGKSPENYESITALDSVFIKMKEEDKQRIIDELGAYNSMVLRIINAGNSACWVNNEDGYSTIVHLKR